MRKALLFVALAASLTGCGAIQNYNQGLENNQRNFERNQALLDEQNTIEVNKLKALQRVQDIQASKAEGQKAQAQAAGEAQAAIEKARGEAQSTLIKAQAQAQATRLLSQSLTPLLVQYRFVDQLSDKSIIYLPSGVLPYMNVATPGALPSQFGH